MHEIHPHIDELTKILLEAVTDLKFMVTPGKDTETFIMVDAKHTIQLIAYVEKIWKNHTITITPWTDRVDKIRIINK